MKWIKYFMERDFDFPNGVWKIKQANQNQTPVALLPEPFGGKIDKDGRNLYQKDNARLVSKAPELKEALDDMIKMALVWGGDRDTVRKAMIVKHEAESDEPIPDYLKQKS